MLVNFSFYIQRIFDIDAEYRIVLTRYSDFTYDRTIVKEGFLSSTGQCLNNDQVVLDLPVNDGSAIKNYFNISVIPIATARTQIKHKGIQISIPMLKINDLLVQGYNKYLRISNTKIFEHMDSFKIGDNAHISVELSAAIIKNNDYYTIGNYHPDSNIFNNWTHNKDPVKL